MAEMVEIMAREMKMKVKAEGESGEFLEIMEIDGTGHTPNTTYADTGTFSRAGRASSLVAERGDAFNLTIKKVIDKTTGKEAPGNERLRELAKKGGHEAVGTFRYVGPTGHGIEFRANVEIGVPVGARNDPAAYSATITVTGDITEVTPSGG